MCGRGKEEASPREGVSNPSAIGGERQGGGGEGSSADREVMDARKRISHDTMGSMLLPYAIHKSVFFKA
jgi:hypothetical protein